MIRRPVVPCRCGARRDDRGRCTHCDYPADGAGGQCEQGCGHCRERDTHCEVCKVRRGTVTAAEQHAIGCRNAEARRERAA